MADSFWDRMQGWLGKPVPDQPVRSSGRGGGPSGPGRARLGPPPPPAIEELQKESEERRYLISAWESSPDLIPEFRQPTYMYKLITTEREYVQAQLHALQQARAALAATGEAEGEAAEELESREIALRMDLNRLFGLIKKVTGVQRTGTGGTDFIPM